MNTLVSDLDNQFVAIKSLPEKAFFVGLADYVQSVNEKTLFAPFIQELHKKVRSDFQELSFGSDRSKPKDTGSKSLDDYIAQGKRLVEEQNKYKQFEVKQQADPAHAWLKLQLLEIMIHDPNAAESLHAKSPRSQFEYNNARKELDMILVSAENQYENEEYISWVESGNAKDMADIPRSYFKKDDYINYLSCFHSYLMKQVSNLKTTTFVSFPAGQTYTYHNGQLSFMFGDGTHKTIDFSTAPLFRKLIESLLELQKRTLANSHKSEDIIVMLRELFDEDIDNERLGKQLVNLRNKKIYTAPELRDRFQINFIKSTKEWELIVK